MIGGSLDSPGESSSRRGPPRRSRDSPPSRDAPGFLSVWPSVDPEQGGLVVTDLRTTRRGTRPSHNFMGSGGKPIAITANYLQDVCGRGQGRSRVRGDLPALVDNREVRFKLVNKLINMSGNAPLGRIKVFDGTKMFCPRGSSLALIGPSQKCILRRARRSTWSPTTSREAKAGDKNVSNCTTCLADLQDASSTSNITATTTTPTRPTPSPLQAEGVARLRDSGGQYKGGLLQCDVSHRVIRTETDTILMTHQKRGVADIKSEVDRLLQQRASRYNNKSYKVDEMDWSRIQEHL